MKYQIEFFEYAPKNPNSILTVIVTYRQNLHYNMIERINYRKKYDLQVSNKINFMIVDDGSSLSDADRTKKICKLNNFDFLYIDSREDYFSPGRARNIGAQYAKTKYIVHEDIDLCPYDGYYNSILSEIESNDLCNNDDDFISIPVVYLTDISSHEYLNNPIQKRKEFIRRLLLGENDWYIFFMPASSVIIINRYYYLTIGGYNEEFSGWGLEDLEYAFRITRLSKKFHTPANYKKLIGGTFSRQFDYCGWRSQFRLHGELCNRKNIILFHIYHPIDTVWRNRKRHINNKNLFLQCIEQFENEGHYLPVLPDIHQGRSLIFGKGCFIYSRNILPYWGNIYIHGYEYFDHVDILEYIKINNINRVVFTNPYANKKRTKIYNIIKNSNINFFVVERGALRDSMFIDPTGFCSESSMYNQKYWDYEISENKKQLVYEYIKEEKNCDVSLEKQSFRIGKRHLMDRLNIPEGKKILFVPLQSRSDTVTTIFAGDIGNYDNFIKLVNDVARNITSEWVILVKKHPLSDADEHIENVIFVNDINIKDLIDISDYILLMNSGVGVLSLLWNKPVLYASKVFYAHDKLNIKVNTYSDVISILEQGFTPDRDISLRFIAYLIDRFYSFGKMTTYEKQYNNNSRLTITQNIDYYNININLNNVFYKNINKKCIEFNSPLYDPFIFSISQKDKNCKIQTTSYTAKKHHKGKNKIYRLFRKLINNPYTFCSDSKYAIVRIFRFLFINKDI